MKLLAENAITPPRHRIHDFFDAGARERHAGAVNNDFALFDAGDCREALYSLLASPLPPPPRHLPPPTQLHPLSATLDDN